jgi:antitoxin MazE
LTHVYTHVYTFVMTTKIKKWGNSYGIRLPKSLLDKLKITEDTEIDLVSKGKTIELKPKKEKKELTLEEMCNQITDENRHEAIDWGLPVGRELI